MWYEDEQEQVSVAVPFGDPTPNEWPRYRENSLFWSAVIEAEQQFQVPREMAMMCALGAISTACQSQVDVELPVQHRVHTPLMLVTLAESGERKTTVQNRFFDAITRLNLEAIKAGEEAQECYEQAALLWKVEEKALNSTLTKAIKSGDDAARTESKEAIRLHQTKKPTPAVRIRFLYEDTTPGALIERLHQHSPYGCLLSSEANSIFSGRAFHELDKLNALWDGNILIVDRLSRPSFVLAGARLTLSLMTQPSVVARFLDKRGEEARGMGFLARFLVVKAKKMAGDRPPKPINNCPHLKAFNDRIEAILTDPEKGALSLDHANDKKNVLTFSSDANSLWYQYAHGVEAAMKDHQPYEYYKDHASKLMDNVSRMAALLHCFEGHDGAISTETLRFCYDFTRKCSTHFQRYFAGEPQIITDANDLAKTLLETIDKKTAIENFRCILSYDPAYSPEGVTAKIREGRKAMFHIAFLKQFGPNRLRHRAADPQLRQAIDLLTKLGHIEFNPFTKWYTFSETIIQGHEPALRNGVEYHLDALPMLNEQRLYMLPGRLGIESYCLVIRD